VDGARTFCFTTQLALLRARLDALIDAFRQRDLTQLGVALHESDSADLCLDTSTLMVPDPDGTACQGWVPSECAAIAGAASDLMRAAQVNAGSVTVDPLWYAFINRVMNLVGYLNDNTESSLYVEQQGGTAP